jgi:hypothetical protein
MSVNFSRPSVAVPSRDEIGNSQSLGDLSASHQHQETSSSAGNLVLNQVNEVALAAAYQEDIGLASPRLQVGEKLPHEPGSPAIEESAEARVERLGRQRPEVFDSIWSEIGFVFSISMSQVLSVRSPFYLSRFHH